MACWRSGSLGRELRRRGRSKSKPPDWRGRGAVPVERHASPALALSPGAAGREALASSWGDTSRTCAALARGCALGKANDASGLTEESRYTIHRVDAHAEKSAGRGARLSQLAAGVGTVHRPRTPPPAPPRALSHDARHRYILRTD